MTKYTRALDMDSWLQDPRLAKRGFAHRWHSSVVAGNGEDAFISLVDSYGRLTFQNELRTVPAPTQNAICTTSGTTAY